MQEKVKIKNSIGKNITAVIHRPETETGKLAILCPGFLDSKDYNGLVELAKILVGRGYVVVRFDPTGTWDSEGSISEYNTTQYLKDIKSVKNYMTKDVNYNSILLGGHSMGGRMSLLYAPTDSEISAVLVIMSSYSKAPNPDKDEKWRNEGVQINNRDIPNLPNERRQYVVPSAFLFDSDKYNALNTLKEFHGPVLLFAGEKDILVLPAVVKTIFDNANNPKKFTIIPNVGHDYRKNVQEVKKVNEEINNCLNVMKL